MAKITKRMKKDGSCSYCIRVSNGYDRRGRQVMVNRTFTPSPGMTGKKLEKELQRQADAFEQEVHAGVLLDASGMERMYSWITWRVPSYVTM